MMNQNPDALLFSTVAAAGEGNDFADRFAAGEHIVALNVCEPKDTTDHGRIISVDFVVLESSTPAYVGKAFGEGYFVQKSDKEGGKGAKQRAFALAKAVVLSLGGNPDDPEVVLDQYNRPVMLNAQQAMTKGIQLVQNTLSEMCRQDQPWRGVVLRASATKKSGKNTGKEYTNVRYAPINQSAQQIGQVRQKLEAAHAVPATGPAPMIAGYAPAATAAIAPPPAAIAPPPAAMTQPMIQQQPATTAPAAAPFGGGTSLLNR